MVKLNLLITGASSGIGRATALYFSRLGHRVFSLDITPTDQEENLTSFVLDVTDEVSIERVKTEILNTGVLFDAIISVAGIHTMASLVEADYSKIKRVIDVNLSGAMLITRAFHPLLKKDGRVVIVTSEVATYSPLPFNGLYNVSKVALDSYAEALRQELNLIGQKVITIRPGAVQTPLEASSAASTESLAKNTVLYEKQAKYFGGLVKKFTGKPLPPEKIAALIYKAVTKRHPRTAYSKNRHLGLMLLSILPHSLQCRIVKLLLNR